MTKKNMLLAAALAAVSGMATAGLVQPAPVIVTVNEDASGSAQGDMVSARFSANAVEFIGCGIRARALPDGRVVENGFCQAADAADVKGFCFTTNPELLKTMQATGDMSFITFSWNADGECTRIGFSTQSFYLPQFADKKAK